VVRDEVKIGNEVEGFERGGTVGYTGKNNDKRRNASIVFFWNVGGRRGSNGCCGDFRWEEEKEPVYSNIYGPSQK